MKQPTIALCMIVKGSKDEAELLDSCLKNVSKHVDAIYLNINTPKGVTVAKEIFKVATKYNAVIKTTVWTGNFVEARNVSFAMAQGEDWILWLDVDDTVDKPEEIHKNIAIASSTQQGIYVKYDYDHDEFGNTTVSHYIARMVRNNGSYKWQSSILDDEVAVHETLVEVLPRPKAISNDFVVVHHSDGNRRAQSLVRNIKLLEGMFERQQKAGEVDARTLFYLATHYYDAGQFTKTKELLQEYMQLSGWAEERCEALVYLGKIYDHEGKKDQARHAYLLAIGEYQNSPRPYIELSELDYKSGRYEESASWIEKCLQLPTATTTMVQRPMESTFKAYMLAAQAYVNIGGKKLDDAQKYIVKALKSRPLDEDAQKAREFIEGVISKREDIRAAMRIVRKFESDDKDKIVPFINSLPDEVQDNPLILNARHEFTVPTKWGKNTIAIYVGQGPLGVWGPWSLESGIGGSEEAVIRLSRELCDLGWEVVIFGTPGDRAGLDHEYESKTGNLPEWKQYYEFNPKDIYNVVISWRNPMFFDADILAEKKYLWLHDVMDKAEFTPERLKKMDKVIFVGQYHAELYKGIIPEEKWFISGNGIDPADFIKEDGKHKRKPHSLLYMSAYNRGLKILLDNWGEIRKAVPGVTLDVYYGWESFDALNKENPERMTWKNELVKQMAKCVGVTDHGRVGQQEIVQAINKADIFAYPCIFPEVYAISYVKAVAGGAYVVSSDFAELGNYEAVLGATHVHYEPGKLDEFIKEYVKTLITALKADRKPSKAHIRARERYSWETTAKQWDGEMK